MVASWRWKPDTGKAGVVTAGAGAAGGGATRVGAVRAGARRAGALHDGSAATSMSEPSSSDRPMNLIMRVPPSPRALVTFRAPKARIVGISIPMLAEEKRYVEIFPSSGRVLNCR